MGRRGHLLGLMLVVSASLAAAQSGPGLRYGEGLRPFADPLYWLNEGPADRVPLRERPLSPRLGFAGLAPPPDRRLGLTPFVAASLTFRNSSEDNTTSDPFAATGLGLTYRFADRRQQVQAEYYAEVTTATGSNTGLDNTGGSLSYTLNIAERDRLSFFTSLSRTTDLQTTTVQGPLPDASTFDTASVILTYGRDHTRRTGYELGVSGLLQSTDLGSDTDADTYVLNGLLWHFLTPADRIATRLRVSDFAIGGDRFNLQRLDMEYTRDLGPRLSASGNLGVIRTSADGGLTLASLGGNITSTARNSRLNIVLERDVIAVPGLSDPALTDQVGLQWQYRLGDGWLSSMTLEHRRFEILSSNDPVTHVNALEGQLSYAVDRKLWLWGRVSLSREYSEGTRSDESRFSVGLSRTLR